MPARSPTIAVLTDRYFQYQAELVEYISGELNQLGYGVVCIAAKELQSKDNKLQAYAVCNEIYEQLSDFDIRGMIALSGTLGHGATINQFLQKYTFPKVSLGLKLDNIASVYFAESKGMTDLMNHLLSCGTRKKFAFLRGHQNDPYSLGREAIFRRCLLERGVKPENIYYLEGDYHPFTAYQVVTDLLLDTRIDCIVAANDVMAASAGRAAKKQGLSIPGDIAISGFDDSSDATSHSPALTTVRQPLKRMALDSVSLLLEQIDLASKQQQSKQQINPELRSITIHSELVIRRSSNPINTESTFTGPLLESTIRNLLEEAMYGLLTPPQLTMKQISEPLWKTLQHGSVDILSLTTDISDNIILNHAHWWINLCDQVDAINQRLHTFEHKHSAEHKHDHNFAHRAIVSSATSKVRERIWGKEMDQQFEIARLQSVRSDMQLALSSCNDMNDILEVMTKWLEELAPKRCFLIQYQQFGPIPDRWATAIHIFKNGSVSTTESRPFESFCILPPELSHELETGLLVFSPVYANNNLFGYLLIDPADMPLNYIDAAAESIGDAMRTQHHIKTLQTQKDSLQSVNAELEQLANFDALTGLANRLQFQHYIEHTAKQSGKSFALLFIDLDGFKLVNDTLGHTMGDKLLNDVAHRLSGCVAASNEYDGFISRLGGDEFTIILHTESASGSVQAFCESLLETLAKPYTLNQNQVSISGSIGCALYPQNSNDVETLITQADIAMYRAKENGKNSVVFYCPSMNKADTRELLLAQELRYALNNNELCMYFQPRIDLKTGKIRAAEALMRWFELTDEGPVVRAYPDVFIALAEKIGVISQLDTYALHYCCRQASIWAKAGTPLQVSVNASVNQLQQSDFVDTVLNALEQHQLDPSLLELEITESAAMTDVESNIEKLSKIRDAGIQVSIDDFGTGYSSLNYLKRLPVHHLKIDRSFIMDITESSGGDSADAAIVRSVVALGKSMEFELIAEGIETEEQHNFVCSLDCDQAQGYLYSKPISADELTTLLHEDADHFPSSAELTETQNKPKAA